MPDCHTLTKTRLRPIYNLAFKPNGAFTLIGAFDGLAGDHIRPLIFSNANWEGALVEPQQLAFAELRNYASLNSRLHFFNCAVSDARGTVDFYEIDENEIVQLNLPGWCREIASLSESHLKKHFGEARTIRRSLPAMTVSAVADACQFFSVELIAMDVEGHERRIIDDIEFDVLGLRVLAFEHKHLSQEDYMAAIGRLTKHGFSIRRYGRDTLAYR